MEKKAGKGFTYTFCSRDGINAGIRLLKPDDALGIIDCFRQVYGWDYAESGVYDEKWLKNIFKSNDIFWIVGEVIETGDIGGCMVFKKENDFSIHLGKAVIKPKYQKKGFAGGLGQKALLYILRNPALKDIIRIDTEMRANNHYSQMYAEASGAKAYGFIPNFGAWGDRRFFDITKGEPYSGGTMESAVLYFWPFNRFWEKRKNEIFLLDDRDIFFIYDYVKRMNRKMKKDTLIFKDMSDIRIVDYKIKEHFHVSIVIIQGILNSESFEKILKKYVNWNLILLKVPTTMEGLHTQKLALEKGFIVLGYDPGSFFKQNIVDSVVLGYFPIGVDRTQFEKIDLLKKNKPIANQVLRSIEGRFLL